jgi:fructuronate reductase
VGLVTGRLSSSALPHLPARIGRPAYDRTATRIGIVHIGTGAFHRAHQAVYVDDLLARHPDWAICGVSLRDRAVRDALRPQDGLYTLALLGDSAPLRVIGSVRELLCARDEQPVVLARLADAAIRLVTLTITEKGYCLAGEDLDATHPDIVHDLVAPATPRSTIGHLVEALRLRRKRALPPFTVLSCDNLPGNGRRLRRALLQFAQRTDPGLGDWIAQHAAFPCSMVDSITPFTDDTLRARVATQLGYVDAWPVQRETYAQWVVEDVFCNERPPLEEVGVTFSRDVGGHDRAKLRLLNGAHSTLAYLGSLLELETVAEAMRTAPLARFVERLMRESIVPATALPAELDADIYVGDILARFHNPAIHHRLSQIAWDGSQKLPVRLLGTIADALERHMDIAGLCLPVAGWMQFVRRQARNGVELVDPLAGRLAAIGLAATGQADHDVGAFLGLESVFGTLAGDARLRIALGAAYALLGDGTPATVAGALHGFARARAPS